MLLADELDTKNSSKLFTQNSKSSSTKSLQSLNSRQNSAQSILLAENSTQALPNSQPSTVQTYTLDAVEINSVGDGISESGIDEGILNKSVASGPLDNKKVLDMPYQVNTITRELLDNQGVQAFDEAVKYFPSAQLQYRGGGEQGRPQTRGFQGSVVGNSFWDGFYSVSTTAIPMAMFESLQVQNGLSGSLYGGQEPAGTFSYQRKRPLKDYNAVWVDYISRSNSGVGLDTADKFQYMGYRAVLYSTNGEREPKGSLTSRQLASFALDFTPLDNLVIETNYSFYRHIMSGYYDSKSVQSTNGVATGEIPSISSITQAPLITTNRQGVTSLNERFMKTTTASGKIKYIPFNNELLYLEGGYQWQRAIRSRDGTSRFTVPSAFVKAQSEFDTSFIHHNLALSANGYQWKSGVNNSLLGDMKNLGLLYDIGLGEYVELIASGSNSWFKSDDYKKSGLSYAGSAIVKIIPNTLNVYFTYADSLKEGTSIFYDPAIYQNHPLVGQTIVFEPYRSQQYEVGVKTRVGEFDLSAAVFQITRPTYYEDDSRVFGKQGEQRNRGVEFTLGGKIIEPLSVYGGVTYLDAKMHKSAKSEVEGKTMIGEPKVQANLLFDFAVPYTEKLAFTTNFHYTGKRFVDEMNTKSVDDYFTTDLGVRYTTKKWVGKETTIRFNVNNLFNEKYWVGMFANGLYDGQAKSGGTSLFRGYDRTYMLSGQVKF